jgi:hypothetical protein
VSSSDRKTRHASNSTVQTKKFWRQRLSTFVNRGTLFAVPFDLDKLETKGLPVPVLQQVSDADSFGSAKISFARTRTLVYRTSDIDNSQMSIPMVGRQ